MSIINNLYTNANSSETTEYDNSVSGLASHDVKHAIDELASLNRMYSFDFTLDSSKWSGSSIPYVYRLTSEEFTSGCNIILDLANNISSEAIEEASIAGISIAEQGVGYIILHANANKPLIDIPVNINIGRMISVADGRNADYITFDNETGESWVTASTVNSALNQILSRVSNIIKSSSASSIEVDDSTLHTGKNTVQGVLEHIMNSGLGISRSHSDIILNAANWTGSGPYIYNIEMDGVTSQSDFEIGTNFYMTTEQYQALTNASIVCGGTFDGRVVLKAFGEKPTINIPVTLIQYT